MSDPSCRETAKTAVHHCRRVLEKAGLAPLLATHAVDLDLAAQEAPLDLPRLMLSQQCLLVVFDGLNGMGPDTTRLVDDARDLRVPVNFVQPTEASLLKTQAAMLLRETTGQDHPVFVYEAGLVGEAVEAALLHAACFVTATTTAGGEFPRL